jgi:hypothetical protein
LEVGDTAGLETCATKASGPCLEKSSRVVTILTDSSAKTRRRKFVRRVPANAKRLGLRQPSGAFKRRAQFKSGRGLPHSKTLRQLQHLKLFFASLH